MWFWFSIIALICWSGSDLFSKIGCADSSDKYSHLKMVTAVGAVMGLHAIYEIFAKGVPIDIGSLLKYLPVSALYILSMAIGYVGLFGYLYVTPYYEATHIEFFSSLREEAIEKGVIKPKELPDYEEITNKA